MNGLIDGLLLFLNNGQVGDYSRSIVNNLIKYGNLDIKIIKDYEIKSNDYLNNSVDMFIDRLNDNFDSVAKYMINNNISYFHCLNNGFSIPKDFEFNYIMNVCNLLPIEFEEFCDKKYLFNFFNKFPHGVFKSKYILCPSISTKNDFLNNFNIDSDKVFINYGCISDFYNKLDRFMSFTYIKSKYDIDYEYIIFYGDFNRRKCLEKSILLFNKMRREYPNLHFLICSNDFRDTQYLEELKRLIYSLGIIDYVFFISNISVIDKVNLFNMCLFFIDLSVYENINLNIVEAFSCEIPIICSYIDLYKEYFGELCFYYSENIDYNIVINYVKQYSLQNKNYVLDKFDRSLSLNIISNIYKKFI